MMSDNILSEGGSLRWALTIDQGLRVLKDLPPKALSGTYAIRGPIGSGKTTVLSWISENFTLNCVEGDVMYALAVALLCDVKGDVRIDHWTQSLQKDIWSMYPDHYTRAQIIDYTLGPHLEKLDVCTNFPGFIPTSSVFVLPDYEFYVTNLNRRTEVIIKTPGAKQGWIDHVIERHKPIPHKEWVDYWDQLFDETDHPIAVVPNLGSKIPWEKILTEFLS